VDRETYSAKTRNFTLKLNLKNIFIPIISSLILFSAGSLVRYFVMAASSKENLIGCRLAKHSIDIYIHILTVNIVVSELILWDNTSQFYYQKPYDYYFKVRNHFEVNVLDRIESILKDNTGTMIDVYKQGYNLTLCKIFEKMTLASYENCDTIMAGIATRPLSQFLRLYLKLIDQLVYQWKSLPKLQDRYSLVTKDEYIGIFAYATHDFFGTGDAIYYHLITPVFALLTRRLALINGVVSLANIIFSIWSGIVLACTLPLIAIRVSSMQKDYWRLYQTLPIALLQTNPIAKNIAKRRIQWYNPF